MSASTETVGTSRAPRNEVIHGPRSGLRQKSVRNGRGGTAVGGFGGTEGFGLLAA